MSFQTFEILDNSRGLINPPMKTDLSAIPTRREDLLTLINRNNYDSKEDFTQKREQAMGKLIDADRPDSYIELAKSEFVDIGLDASIYADLERDARRNRDNYMNAESQDFVNQIQQSVQSFTLEQNLYGQPPSKDFQELRRVFGMEPESDITLTEAIVNRMRGDQKRKIDEEIFRNQQTSREQRERFKDEL